MKKWLWIMLSVGVILLVFMMNYFVDKRQQQPNMTQSVSLTTSTSPNKKNVVEVKKMYRQSTDYFDYEQKQKVDSVRMYYGQSGSMLSQYKELKGIQPSKVHDVDVYWKGNRDVIIDVINTSQEQKSKIKKRFNYNLTEL
ncbi:MULTISPECIES: hypothetical protein [Priestia]|uniref:hypothetical protein n=1 Tax=Priestia TaxID=2800373 RepID=UPI0007626A29|nr:MULTISPECIES: hypothetical protein [Priestia]KWU56908.1 hypothetical protein AWX17_26240 [Priestia megaterium]MCE4092743.1 hypothetical protein [Priestia megaterium]MED3822052.1 hypothetical protein [Priestia aryabhattai]